MDKINSYKITFTKQVEYEMYANSEDKAIEMAIDLDNDDGMTWEKPYDKIECEEITTGYYCPVCGSSLMYQSLHCEPIVVEKIYSCANDDCALDWTITEDKENGNFLGIKRHFHG